MIEYIAEHADVALHADILAATEAKACGRKRRRAETQHARRVAQRLDEAPVARDPARYLSLPSEQDVLQCYRDFRAATSNAALSTAVCAICAREVSVPQDHVETVRLDSLANRARLAPRDPHPQHELYQGCLLEPRGTPGYRPPSDTLQRGMRGTVSTYELDTQGVSDMIDGALMPRLPSVLATVISVTFVGVGPLPKQWLRTTFRVRRPVVHAALQHLRQAHRHYRNITISEARLAALPEDDVPEELLGVVRQCSDAFVPVQESAGYVADDDDDDVLADPSHDEGPDVVPLIPMHVSGSVDTDLSRMSANEMMLWGLQNLWKTTGEGGYSVRHGHDPVSDFRNPASTPAGSSQAPQAEAAPPPSNYYEKAFPCLFPYGRGGLEGDQLVRVDFREHVQWALRYHDRRFRTHETFPFVVFGIQQRRQALGSAKVQIRRKAFEQEVRVLSSITTATLERATQQEAAKQAVTDPAILLLKRLVHGAAGRVHGTDAARYRIRGQIWSTCLVHGPPSLWITINPTDIHDPIAQVFAGHEIDLDRFVATVGPKSEERAAAIAQDPFAAAKFFHFMIDTILQTLFRISVSPFVVKGDMGVLGKASAYIGSVESQGRGSLHLHMLVWLQDTPTSEQLHELLRTEQFRARVVAYIRANIRAYLPGLETAQSVKAIPKEKEIAYNRPPDPASPTFAADCRDFELRLARVNQVHTCKVKRCLRFDRTGRLVCKRRAPFEHVEDDYVDPDGRWGQKRLYRYMNGWIPAVLVNARCNNDGKLLTNGADTKNITFYVSSYAGKKQGRNYNVSAVLADGFAYDEAHKKPEYMHDIREQHRLLLFRLMNSINREQELAGPMVVSYLMGWSDVKTSHTYAALYWSSFMAALYRAHPALCKDRM
ncbi:hypothetical protein OH76DRAFT_1362182 [Lentinus brumalis]|uniref:Uncharacterized protein n=1 Tax=Lentinus brumalis TaxID=2498619 RepID=A0A371CR57_9APHY|nr:hypothetical protein OH76DRAFT_1362182 [Polyporus brumalis]